jgi:hypothetical protein
VLYSPLKKHILHRHYHRFSQCVLVRYDLKYREILSMTPVSAAKIKYGVWGIILGAVIAMIVGFGWGGWSTFGTTKTMTQEAVLASQAAICVAQFMKQPNVTEKLKEFEEFSSWKKDEFIEKGGWDKMPGQKEANQAVARACADGLELLIEKRDK